MKDLEVTPGAFEANVMAPYRKEQPLSTHQQESVIAARQAAVAAFIEEHGRPPRKTNEHLLVSLKAFKKVVR